MQTGNILMLVALGLIVLGLFLFFGVISTTPFSGKTGLASGLSTSSVFLAVGLVMIVVVSFMIKNNTFGLTIDTYQNRHEK
jgi:hypothetical protein